MLHSFSLNLHSSASCCTRSVRSSPTWPQLRGQSTGCEAQWCARCSSKSSAVGCSGHPRSLFGHSTSLIGHSDSSCFGSSSAFIHAYQPSISSAKAPLAPLCHPPRLSLLPTHHCWLLSPRTSQPCISSAEPAGKLAKRVWHQEGIIPCTPGISLSSEGRGHACAGACLVSRSRGHIECTRLLSGRICHATVCMHKSQLSIFKSPIHSVGIIHVPITCFAW